MSTRTHLKTCAFFALVAAVILAAIYAPTETLYALIGPLAVALYYTVFYIFRMGEG